MRARDFSAGLLDRVLNSPALLLLLAGVVFAGVVAWTLGGDELGGGETETPSNTGAAKAVFADPLVAELTRCQALGEAGARDEQCLRAWAETRRRFLGVGAPLAAPFHHRSPSSGDPSSRPLAGRPTAE